MRIGRILQIIIMLTVLALVVRTIVPYAADHNETALPIPGGLPFRLHHADRTYMNVKTCTGEDWCPGRPFCGTMAELDMNGWTPLVPIGAVPTLFGPSQPEFAAPDSIVPNPTADTSTNRLVVYDRDGCYVVYVLSGGL